MCSRDRYCTVEYIHKVISDANFYNGHLGIIEIFSLPTKSTLSISRQKQIESGGPMHLPQGPKKTFDSEKEMARYCDYC